MRQQSRLHRAGCSCLASTLPCYSRKLSFRSPHQASGKEQARLIPSHPTAGPRTPGRPFPNYHIVSAIPIWVLDQRDPGPFCSTRVTFLAACGCDSRKLESPPKQDLPCLARLSRTRVTCRPCPAGCASSWGLLPRKRVSLQHQTARDDAEHESR